MEDQWGLNQQAKEMQVLSSVMKWCWSRLAGGVVTWEAYELFKVGETGRKHKLWLKATSDIFRRL